MRNFDQTQVLLGSELGLCRFVKRRSGNGFYEQLGHFFGSSGVHRTVDSNYAAEGRYGITLERFLVGLNQGTAGRCAAGIGVLDNRADCFGEFLREIPGCLQVNNVVVGKLFALQLTPIRYAGARAIGIHGGFLVRIFSVAQIQILVEREPQRLRESLLRVQFETPVRAYLF